MKLTRLSRICFRIFLSSEKTAKREKGREKWAVVTYLQNRMNQFNTLKIFQLFKSIKQ